MIDSLHVTGYKSLRQVSFEGLQRLTVLVGASGVGKTSVLAALHQLTQLSVHDNLEAGWVNHRVGRIFRGATAPERLVSQGSHRFQLSCHADDCQFDLTATPAGYSENHDIATFVVGLRDQAGEKSLALPEQRDQASGFFGHPFFKRFGSAVFLKLDARRAGKRAKAESKPRVNSDGSGLASVLAYYAGAYRETLEEIEEELRQVIGTTRRIRTFPDQMQIEERELIRLDEHMVPRRTHRQVLAHRFEVEIDGLGSIPGDLLSEGTLTTLALLAVLHQPDGPQLLLLDDIDQGLHPMAQKSLIEALRSLLAKRPDVQIICTSHSPYLLDHFRPEEVQVMSLGDSSHVSAARLDQHPEWPKWKGMMQTGEFWQSVGEAWVVAKAAEDGR